MIEIKKGSKSFYVGASEENPLAVMSFIVSDDKITVDHTYVSHELRGQGIAQLLLKELIDWARKENKKIVPLCSFVKVVMEKNKEYTDMIYK